jgi:hypothetical protein
MRIPAGVPTLVAAIAFTSAAGPGFAALDASQGPKPAITLRVLNEGAVDTRFLLLAKKEAAKILARSGIDLVWLDCEAGNAEWGSISPCQRALEPAEFWMRVVTRGLLPAAAPAGDVLGFTEPEENRITNTAVVRYAAAVDADRKWRGGVGEILGAIMAHEVGHLLLGARAHSPYGVMCAYWGRVQFELIGQSQLSFTPDQAKKLREQIENRVRTSLAARR